MKIKGFGKIVLGAGIVGGLLYWIGSSIANAVQYEFLRVKWEGGNLSGVNLALVYRLKNNQNVSLTINRLDAQIRYGEYEIANLGVSAPVAMLPGEEKIFEVGFKVTTLKLASEILKFFVDKAGFKKFDVKGKITVTPANLATVTIPFSEKLQMAE